MPVCPFCGKEMAIGETWIEKAGFKAHFECWVRAGMPSVPPAAPPPSAPLEYEYVIPLSLQEEFMDWNRRAKDVSPETEWGGNLYLRGNVVTLEEPLIEKEKKYAIDVPEPIDEARNPLGTVHYHPGGSGPSASDLADWCYTATRKVSPKLNPLFIITYDEGFCWYLCPKGPEIDRKFGDAVDRLWGTDALKSMAKNYFPKRPERIGMVVSLQFIVMKHMLDEAMIKHRWVGYGSEVRIRVGT
jgi:hypothetical protein